MENLIKLAEELNEKYNYLRHGLKKFLDKWEKATELDLKDDSLLTATIGQIPDLDGYTDVYFLERGENYIFRLYIDQYDNAASYQECVEYASMIDVDEAKIYVIKSIIKKLPIAINKYLNEINNKLDPTDEIINEFKKEFAIK